MQSTLGRGREWPGNPPEPSRTGEEKFCREKSCSKSLTQPGALRPDPSQLPPGYSGPTQGLGAAQPGRPRSLRSGPYYPPPSGKGNDPPLPSTVLFPPLRSLDLAFLDGGHEGGLFGHLKRAGRSPPGESGGRRLWETQAGKPPACWSHSVVALGDTRSIDGETETQRSPSPWSLELETSRTGTKMWAVQLLSCCSVTKSCPILS